MNKENNVQRNAGKLADFLFDKIFEIDAGLLDAKKAEQIFNGAGKWERVVRLKMEYGQLKKLVGEIKQIEESERPYVMQNELSQKRRILETNKEKA